MLDQDENFNLISLSILITFLRNNVWILLGEVMCQSLLGVKGCSGNFMVEALTSSLSPPKPYQDQQ